jgi:mitogen-activated protein kinase kinase kinase
LRNFFGQRPPSELITHHLQDYFPNAEKKVIKRAYRKSMLRQNKDRQSLLMDHDGWNLNIRDSQALPSRFSMSSLGSTPRRSLSEKRGSTMFAPTPIGQQEDFQTREDRQIPRVSVSTESGESHDLTQDEAQASRASTPRSTQLPQLLPPVSLDQETFSESFELLPGIGEPGPLQASTSDAKGKIPDASSMLTIDEITAEVESRRNSIIASGSSVSETGIRPRDSLSVPFPIIEDKTLEEAIEEEDSDYDSDEYEVEGGLQAAHEDGSGDNQLEEEDILSDEDEGPSKAVTSKGGGEYSYLTSEWPSPYLSQCVLSSG